MSSRTWRRQRPIEALQVVGQVLQRLLGGVGIDDLVVGAGQEDDGVQDGQQQRIDAQLRRESGERPRRPRAPRTRRRRSCQPPATAGMIASSSPSLTAVARLSR